MDDTSRAGAGRSGAPVVAGVIHYRAYDLLGDCLGSLLRQTLAPREIWVIDNDADEREAARIRAAFPVVRYVANADNRGYAGAANQLIELADSSCDVLVLTPDARLSETFLAAIAEFHLDERAGILGGKLLRPDGSIDSVGIEMRKNGRARDMQPDPNDVPKEPFPVFAVCGAAILLRRALLDDLGREHGEWYDPSFFAYHEDVDLAWRARWLGWTCWTVPGADAEHLRGWQVGQRSAMPRLVRRHAFKNHYLRLAKVVPASMLVRYAPWLIGWEILRLGYALLREPDVLPAYLTALRALPAAWRKRRRILGRRRVPPHEILAWVR